MKTIRYLLAVLLLLLPLSSARASQEIFRLDPESTRVTFSVGATFHTVNGTARLTRGEIRLDPDSGAASGEVVIDAGSLSTQEASRDRKMQADVLESGKFPEISFTADRILGTLLTDGASEVTLQGTIEIHGEKHPLSIPTHVHASGGRISGTAGFLVPYVEWGMKDPSVFFFRMKKQVAINLDFAGGLVPVVSDSGN